MDNFMDRITQRFNAQEIIKANAQAEAQELGRLREQMKDYDKCMQEMRRLNLKNVEATEKLRALAEKVNALAGRALAGIDERGRQENAQTGRLAAFQETVAAVRRDVKKTQEETGKTQEQMTAVQEGIYSLQNGITVVRDQTTALQTE